MNRALKIALLVLLGPVFAALLLMMFFGGPAEIAVASWHMLRAQPATDGKVLTSYVARHKGSERSDMAYVFHVDGRTFTSTRFTTGFLSDRIHQPKGGDFATTHPPGTSVKVHYDPKHPDLALLEYGWSGWSIGWTLFVWGMVLGRNLSLRGLHTRSQTVIYALVRGIVVMGFLTLITMNTVVPPHKLPHLAGLYLVSFVATLIYANARFKAPAMRLGSSVT